MRLTELHSGRLDEAIRKAIRDTCRTIDLEYEDEDGDLVLVRATAFHVPSLARAIIMQLQALEKSLEKETDSGQLGRQ